jgi:hypothetical protein
VLVISAATAGVLVPTWAPQAFLATFAITAALCGLAGGRPRLARLESEAQHVRLESMISSALDYILGEIGPLLASLAFKLRAQAPLASDRVGFGIFTGPPLVGVGLGSEGSLFWRQHVGAPQ